MGLGGMRLRSDAGERAAAEHREREHTDADDGTPFREPSDPSPHGDPPCRFRISAELSVSATFPQPRWRWGVLRLRNLRRLVFVRVASAFARVVVPGMWIGRACGNSGDVGLRLAGLAALERVIPRVLVRTGHVDADLAEHGMCCTL